MKRELDAIDEEDFDFLDGEFGGAGGKRGVASWGHDVGGARGHHVAYAVVVSVAVIGDRQVRTGAEHRTHRRHVQNGARIPLAEAFCLPVEGVNEGCGVLSRSCLIGPRQRCVSAEDCVGSGMNDCEGGTFARTVRMKGRRCEAMIAPSVQELEGHRRPHRLYHPIVNHLNGVRVAEDFAGATQARCLEAGAVR